MSFSLFHILAIAEVHQWWKKNFSPLRSVTAGFDCTCKKIPRVQDKISQTTIMISSQLSSEKKSLSTSSALSHCLHGRKKNFCRFCDLGIVDIFDKNDPKVAEMQRQVIWAVNSDRRAFHWELGNSVFGMRKRTRTLLHARTQTFGIQPRQAKNGKGNFFFYGCWLRRSCSHHAMVATIEACWRYIYFFISSTSEVIYSIV